MKARQNWRPHHTSSGSFQKLSRMAVAFGLGAFFMTVSLQGKLSFETQMLKLRASPTDESVPFSFDFVNKGDAVVEIIGMRSSCGCAVAKPEQKRYQPGEHGRIKGHFTVGNRRGLQSNRIVVETNSPSQPEVELGVDVEVPVWLRMQPGLLIWASEEADQTKSVVLRPNSDIGVEIQSVEPRSETFDVVWTMDLIEDAVHRLEVFPRSGEGIRRCRIQIVISVPDGSKRTKYAYLMVR